MVVVGRFIPMLLTTINLEISVTHHTVILTTYRPVGHGIRELQEVTGRQRQIRRTMPVKHISTPCEGSGHRVVGLS